LERRPLSFEHAEYGFSHLTEEINTESEQDPQNLSIFQSIHHIHLSITRALRRLDALLEYQQAQAEQGMNVVYLYWRRVQAERACLQRQVITDFWRLRYA
jgi:hypothetical protein